MFERNDMRISKSKQKRDTYKFHCDYISDAAYPSLPTILNSQNILRSDEFDNGRSVVIISRAHIYRTHMYAQLIVTDFSDSFDPQQEERRDTHTQRSMWRAWRHKHVDR